MADAPTHPDFINGVPRYLNELMEELPRSFATEIRTVKHLGDTAWVACREQDPDLPNPLGELTEREYQIAILGSQALSNTAIAELLIVEKNTVKFHATNAYAKLGVHGRVQAAAFFPIRETDLLKLPLVGIISPEAEGKLTPTEKDILNLIADGASNDEILARLEIEDQTRKFHVGHIADKLGIKPGLGRGVKLRRIAGGLKTLRNYYDEIQETANDMQPIVKLLLGFVSMSEYTGQYAHGSLSMHIANKLAEFGEIAAPNFNADEVIQSTTWTVIHHEVDHFLKNQLEDRVEVAV